MDALKGIIAPPPPLEAPSLLLKGTLVAPIVARPAAPPAATAAANAASSASLRSVAAVTSAKPPYISAEYFSCGADRCRNDEW